MDYSSESISFLDTCISIRDGHLSTSFYCKPMVNVTMLHLSSFHPKRIKEAIPYGQALRICRIFLDEEERDRPLKILNDAILRTGYIAQLVDRQFWHATAKTRNNLLGKQTQAAIDREPFVIQYFPGMERLCHVLHSLQHVIND
eukprot:g22928.t1